MEKKIAIVGATALMEMALNSPEKLAELGTFRVVADEEVNKNDFFKPNPTIIIAPLRQLDYCFTEPINNGQKKFRKGNNKQRKSKRK